MKETYDIEVYSPYRLLMAWGFFYSSKYESKMTNCLIKELDELPSMTKNALRSIGIIHCTDLAKLSLKDLKRTVRIGEKGKKAIIDFCTKHQIELSKTSYFMHHYPEFLKKQGIQNHFTSTHR